MKKVILLGLSFLFLLSIFKSNAFAGVQDFKSGNACYTGISINETISVKTVGQTGSGCDFSVDVTAGGEFVGTGKYFDSPPYAWGSDKFHKLPGGNANNSFSFTCSQPAYTIDESKLPSYITLREDESIPGVSTTTPVGKRYHFSVEEGAKSGDSFNLPFAYTTDCNMKIKDAETENVRTATPVSANQSGDDESGGCGNSDSVKINPRKKSMTYRVQIGASCSPQSTNTPPPPACNTSCSTDFDCTGAKDGCTSCVTGASGTKTCKTPPACNTTCSTDFDCAGAKDGCTSCLPGASGTKTCKTPPACNTTCSTDFDCAGAKDGCTACLPGANGTKTCRPKLTPTPTATPTPTVTPTPAPACNISCERNDQCAGAKDGCTFCNPGTKTCRPPNTPTPTPFNAAACKCDGITYTNIASGQPLTITSFGKVEGSDISKAIIQDQKFFLAEGAETLATIIARSDAVPATLVSNTSALARYSSVWNITLPQLKSGATYRIWSQINCQPKLTAVNTPHASKRVVLAATTERSWLDRFIASVFKLFGGGEKFENAGPTVTPVPVGGSATDVDATPTGKKSLQLQTLQPVEVYQKTCSFIKFRYNFNASN